MRDTGNITTISSLIFLSIITILGISILVGSLLGSTLGIEPNETSVTFGCVPISGGLHCDMVPNRFSSFIVSGQAKAIYQTSPDYFEGVPGKFGNALPLKGYIGDVEGYPCVIIEREIGYDKRYSESNSR